MVINKILEEKIIVIVRGVERDKLVPLAEALYNGGIRLMEITYDAKGETSDETTAENIAILAKHFENRMLIGAGTVIRENQVTLTKNAGGKFIISPDTNTEIIAKTKELGLVSIPGALTPSEIITAHNAGADFVKLFPVTSLGSDYVKAVSAPLSHVRLLAVGGIDHGNMSEYLKAGVKGFGIGSTIINKKMLENGDYKGITELTESFIKNIK